MSGSSEADSSDFLRDTGSKCPLCFPLLLGLAEVGLSENKLHDLFSWLNRKCDRPGCGAEGKLLNSGICDPRYDADLAKRQQAQGLRCSGCSMEGKRLTCGMCRTCYDADLAKRQQAQGRRCSGCGMEGKLIVSRGLCETCMLTCPLQLQLLDH